MARRKVGAGAGPAPAAPARRSPHFEDETSHQNGSGGGGSFIDRINSVNMDYSARRRRNPYDLPGNFRHAYSITLVLVVAFVTYYAYQGYLETRICTQHWSEQVRDFSFDSPNRFWGSYRPGVYFGMKHRSRKSLNTGLMWLRPSKMRPGDPGLRHLCRQEDNIKKYGWIEHDGSTFGVQTILDDTIKITTSFVIREGSVGVNAGDWTSRITVEPISNLTSVTEDVILFYYVALEPGLPGRLLPETTRGDEVSAIEGNTEELGNFIVRFLNGKGVLRTSYVATSINSMLEIVPTTLQNVLVRKVNGQTMYDLKSQVMVPTPNFVVYEVHSKGPITLEVVFETENNYERETMLAGETYSKELKLHSTHFKAKFEDTFHLKKKGFNASAVHFAQAALSNLLGGIGYFYGASKVQSEYNDVDVKYWAAPLYTAVPSRSFFPRGFLWDEGFHLLLINKWNPEISVDILAHWLDLMNVEGWIPREQILGDEALQRVPGEFVVQRNNVANPPTLLIALADLLQRHQEWLIVNHKQTLHRMWPRLSSWYHWMNRTQIGEIIGTYRWRGRNETTLRELNPKTLASGLDDYPRASHPTDFERHLDLRCWMAVMSKLMMDLAEILGHKSSPYAATYKLLSDPELLDAQHWSEELKAYTDYGLHSQKVALVDSSKVRGGADKQGNGQTLEKVRYDITPPVYQFVDMYGYVSLFPMLLEILEPESEKLAIMIKDLDNPKRLWTQYGLRSLSTTAPLYNVRNTEHDPPYWRGPIWININFLALKALKHYSLKESPISSMAKEKYEELRNNVVGNVMREYFRTGYIWEQYSDKDGKGKGCRPFTGWSSLVVLIMAEEY